MLSQNLLDAMFRILKILVEKKQKNTRTLNYVDRLTEKQKKTKATKKAKYCYLIKLARVVFLIRAER